MCTSDQISAMGAATAPGAGNVNRRQFGVLGATGAFGALAACSTDGAMASQSAGGLVEAPVSFAAPGGTFDGVFIHPASGSHPAVIIWPDIAGLRPAKVEMGRRLAAEGYAVLVANPFYRSVSGQQFADFDAWRNGGGFDVVRPWMAENTPENVMETARAVVAWLDGQDAVDASRGIGSQGYCMTGSWTIYSAAAVPSRVKAAASFHGGGLVGEAETAPVNLLDDLAADAQAMIAISRDDDANAPDAKFQLTDAGDAAAALVYVEVFDGDHGWTVLDSPVYDQAEADRAWAALLGLYGSAL